MGQVAVFDTNVGFLQWVGEAKDHEAAIKALHDDVGLYESSANREDVLERAGEDSLRLLDVTDAQAAALQEWADHGFRGSSYPEGLGDGVVYSQGEVLGFLDSWDLEKKSALPEFSAPAVAVVEEKYVVKPEKDSVVVTRLKDGATLFMQGDDASQFLNEVDSIEDVGFRNHAISQYDDVFDLPQQAAGEAVRLSDDKLRGILAKEGEGMNAANVGFYPSVDALVKKVRGSKNWEQGSIFVFAESEDKFVVMKQVAPASCELLTITQHGYKDVITGYAFGHDDLVAIVKDYMEDDLALKDVSLAEAFEIGMQKGSCSVVDTAFDKSYSGKVLGVTGQHVVLSLGRSALVVSQSDIDRVPATGEDVDLKFTGGKGVLSPVNAVGVER